MAILILPLPKMTADLQGRGILVALTKDLERSDLMKGKLRLVLLIVCSPHPFRNRMGMNQRIFDLFGKAAAMLQFLYPTGLLLKAEIVVVAVRKIPAASNFCSKADNLLTIS